MSSTMHQIMSIATTMLVVVCVLSVIVLVNYATKEDRMKGLKS